MFGRITTLCLGVAALAAVPSPASATADASPEVVVHQEADGSLWYNWYDAPPNKHFFAASKACWLDHDHINLGGWGRQGCLASRP